MTILALANSPADILRYALIAIGQGLLPLQGVLTNQVVWPVFESNEPSNPDNVITCYDTSPQVDGLTQPDSDQLYHYGWQIRVRGLTKPVAFAKIESIRLALKQSINRLSVSPPGGNYILYAVTKIGGNIFLGIDSSASRRTLYTLNGFMAVRRTS